MSCVTSHSKMVGLAEAVQSCGLFVVGVSNDKKRSGVLIFQNINSELVAIAF